MTDDAAQRRLTGQSAAEAAKAAQIGITTETAKANSGALFNTFDAEKVQQDIDTQIAVTKEFGKIAPKIVADVADSLGNTQEYEIKLQLKGDLESLVANSSDPEKRALAQAELNKVNTYLVENKASYDLWKEGGIARGIAQGGVGGLMTGDFGGAAAGFGTSLAAPVLNDLSGKHGGSVINTFASAAIGGALGGNMGGAVVGTNVDANNRQLHPVEIDIINTHAKDFALKQGISEEEARSELASAALSQVDAEYSYLISDKQNYRDAQAFLKTIGAGESFKDDYGRTQTLFDERGKANFYDYAMNTEYVYGDNPFYDNIKAHAPAFAGHLNKEILWKAGSSHLADTVNQPETVKKLVLNNIIEGRTKIVDELTDNRKRAEKEHGWEKESDISVPLIGDLGYKISGIRRAEVSDEQNRQRVSLQSISTFLDNSYAGIYSATESDLTSKERKHYQSAGNLLSGFEALAAIDATVAMTGNLGKNKTVITKGIRQGTQEAKNTFKEAINRG
ncbi:hypothetical protein KRX19_09610 [Cardiobacteriaceae bacterium TAE3-ERU3]|nr:hypothetical protein [Cardiobacteriaceae bacterium TAE3-ERU3]